MCEKLKMSHVPHPSWNVLLS